MPPPNHAHRQNFTGYLVDPRGMTSADIVGGVLAPSAVSVAARAATRGVSQYEREGVARDARAAILRATAVRAAAAARAAPGATPAIIAAQVAAARVAASRPAGPTVGYAERWSQEFSTYCTNAIAEYPAAHPDRARYTTARTRIQTAVRAITSSPAVQRQSRDRQPDMLIRDLDQAYLVSGVAGIVALPPVPAGFTREWHNNDWLFVSSALALNATDYGYLRAAMIQDMADGTTRGALRHWSAVMRGNIAGLIWYTHQYHGNRLLGVSACNPAAMTITVASVGTVNGGEHRF